MSTNYHTPILNGAPANANTFNDPLSQLDTAISGVILGTTPLNPLVETLAFDNPASAKTIAAGVITIDASSTYVETEALAASDDLTNILGGVDGQILYLRQNTTSRDVRIVHDFGGVGSIHAPMGFSFPLPRDPNLPIMLLNIGGDWYVQDVGAAIGHRVTASVQAIIAGGVIACTSPWIRVDTEGGASTDNLDTITASAALMGQIVILQILSDARLVVVRDNSVSGGNIYLAQGSQFTLSNNAKTLMLVCNGSLWYELAPRGRIALVDGFQTQADPSSLVVHRHGFRVISAEATRLELLVDPIQRYQAYWQPAPGPTLIGVGVPDGAIVGTAAFDAPNWGSVSPMFLLSTTAVLGNRAALASPTVNYTSHINGATFRILVRTWAGTDITDVRFQIGLTSVAFANDDAHAGSEAYFRFSTAAGDTTWKCVSGTGGARTIVDSGVAIAGSTFYKFEIRAQNSEWAFYINDSLVATISTNVGIGGSIVYGWEMSIFTLAASIKNLAFYRAALSQGTAP